MGKEIYFTSEEILGRREAMNSWLDLKDKEAYCVHFMCVLLTKFTYKKERKVDLHETFKGICPIFVLERQKQRSRVIGVGCKGRILIFTLSKSKLETCTQISDLFD